MAKQRRRRIFSYWQRSAIPCPGRFAASVDDVKSAALPALRHRVLLNFEGEAEGVKTDDLLHEILKSLPETVK